MNLVLETRLDDKEAFAAKWSLVDGKVTGAMSPPEETTLLRSIPLSIHQVQLCQMLDKLDDSCDGFASLILTDAILTPWQQPQANSECAVYRNKSDEIACAIGRIRPIEDLAHVLWSGPLAIHDEQRTVLLSLCTFEPLAEHLWDLVALVILESWKCRDEAIVWES